jgi:hypothetical protein
MQLAEGLEPYVESDTELDPSVEMQEDSDDDETATANTSTLPHKRSRSEDLDTEATSKDSAAPEQSTSQLLENPINATPLAFKPPNYGGGASIPLMKPPVAKKPKRFFGLRTTPIDIPDDE